MLQVLRYKVSQMTYTGVTYLGSRKSSDPLIQLPLKHGVISTALKMVAIVS